MGITNPDTSAVSLQVYFPAAFHAFSTHSTGKYLFEVMRIVSIMCTMEYT
jgi:hypothetical protein